MPEPLIYPVAPVFPAGPDVPLYRWATVTQASPLRVRLDGDDSALLSDPWDMAGPRRVGERVYCQVSQRRVILLGPTTRPGELTDLSGYLNTSIWEAYGTEPGRPALQGTRWGPWIEITGELKVKTGHPWIGITDVVTAGQLIASGLPPEWRLRTRGAAGVSDAGQNRQTMSGSSSWYVFTRADLLYGARLAIVGGAAVSTSTWFPFRISGFSNDSL